MTIIAASSEEENALIFDIQRFSIHDGPGIRTTVFFKGCPLQCLWCSNPESISREPNLLVRDVNCKLCGDCVEACPESCISISEEGDRKVDIDWSRCTQCFKCVDSCHYGALNVSGQTVDVNEIVDTVLKDRVFYETSGGGITVSGGEPLQQSRFLVPLLAACKKEGLHTTVDTSGFAPWKNLEAVLPYADLFMFDIKIIDPVAHKQLTHTNNRVILENLEKLAGKAKVWIRIPLIAGINDSVEQIEEVAKLASKVGAEQISLLPYHEGGMSKCAQIGKPYELQDACEPSCEHMEELAAVINREGLKAVVGA